MANPLNIPETIICYHPEQKKLYMNQDPACIYPQWDSRKGIHRRGGNFAAMVARKHYEDRGYRVLPQYYLLRCKGQRAWNEGFRKIARIFGREKMSAFLTSTQHLGGGDPDLFVYSRDESECFFVEAKAADTGDRLNHNQLRVIPLIKKYLCPVYLAIIVQNGKGK